MFPCHSYVHGLFGDVYRVLPSGSMVALRPDAQPEPLHRSIVACKGTPLLGPGDVMYDFHHRLLTTVTWVSWAYNTYCYHIPDGGWVSELGLIRVCR